MESDESQTSSTEDRPSLTVPTIPKAPEPSTSRRAQRRGPQGIPKISLDETPTSVDAPTTSTLADDGPVAGATADESAPRNALRHLSETTTTKMRESDPSIPAPKKQVTPVSKTAASPKIPTRDEFPQEEWLELLSNFEGTGELVRLDIRRASPAGQWNSIRTILLPPRKVPDIKPALTALAGGGKYIFEVQDKGTRQRLLPRWQETIESQIKAPIDGVTIIFDADTDDLKLGPQGIETFAGWQPPPSIAQQVQNPIAQGAPVGYGVPVVPPIAGGYGAPAPVVQGQQHQLPPFPVPQRDLRGNVLPPPEELLPGKWAKGYPVHEQWRLAENHYETRYGVAPQTPADAAGHATAMQWVVQQQGAASQAEMRAARAEERVSSERTQMQLLLDAEREKARAAQVEVEKLRARTEAQELKAQLSMLETKIQLLGTQPQKPALDVVALAAAVAPIVTAFITASSSRASAERAEQNELMKTMLAAQPKSNIAETLTAVAPLVTPVLVQWLSNQSPEKLADMRMSMDESRMGLLKMMHDLIQSSTPRDEPEPWWKPVLMAVLNEVRGFGREMALAGAAQRQLPSGMPHHMLPVAPPEMHPQAQQAPQQRAPQGVVQQAVEQAAIEPVAAIVTPPPQGVPGNFDPLLNALAQTDPEAARATALLLQNLLMGVQAGHPAADPRFLTHEWVVILFNLHAKLSPDEIIPLVLEHISHLATFQMLPGVLLNVFDEPEKAIPALLAALPTLDTKYVETLTPMLIDAINESTSDVEDEDEESEEVEEHAAQA